MNHFKQGEVISKIVFKLYLYPMLMQLMQLMELRIGYHINNVILVLLHMLMK